MAEIAPFRGIRYAPERVGQLADVVAPPYDIVTPEQRAALVERSTRNIVEIDLPAGRDDLKYEHAGQLWRQWRAEGTLRTDAVPAIYLLQETFVTPFGQAGVRRGFIAALRLEDLGTGGVRAHERTFAGPKADRLKLMQATKANLSQVFALYRDPERALDEAWERVTRTPFDAEVRSPECARKLWMVTDGDILGLAAKVLCSSPLIIADGHHRYETAITYRDECLSRGEDVECGWLMVYLSSMDDPDLAILPTHRLVKLKPGTDMLGIRARLEEQFDTEPLSAEHPERWLAEVFSEGTSEPYQFGFFCREWGWLLARLRSWQSVSAWINPRNSEAWRRLDVVVLHELVLNRLVRLDETGEGDEPVSYTPDAAMGYRQVLRGASDLLCMVRPPTARQIADVADARATMPHKSTYFYPKLLTGLVMRSLER